MTPLGRTRNIYRHCASEMRGRFLAILPSANASTKRRQTNARHVHMATASEHAEAVSQDLSKRFSSKVCPVGLKYLYLRLILAAAIFGPRSSKSFGCRSRASGSHPSYNVRSVSKFDGTYGLQSHQPKNLTLVQRPPTREAIFIRLR